MLALKKIGTPVVSHLSRSSQAFFSHGPSSLADAVEKAAAAKSHLDVLKDLYQIQCKNNRVEPCSIHHQKEERIELTMLRRIEIAESVYKKLFNEAYVVSREEDIDHSDDDPITYTPTKSTQG